MAFKQLLLMLPLELHKKLIDEKQERKISLQNLILQILEEHFFEEEQEL